MHGSSSALKMELSRVSHFTILYRTLQPNCRTLSLDLARHGCHHRRQQDSRDGTWRGAGFPHSSLVRPLRPHHSSQLLKSLLATSTVATKRRFAHAPGLGNSLTRCIQMVRPSGGHKNRIRICGNESFNNLRCFIIGLHSNLSSASAQSWRRLQTRRARRC